jgi:AraC-like DNA-binding protein
MFVPADIKIKDLEAPQTQSDLISGLILIILPLAIYWILSYKKLLAHQKNVRLFASNTEGVDLAWLRYFLWGLAAMLVAWFSELVWSLPIISYLSNLIYLASAFYLAYFALQQGEIFSEKPQEALDLKTIIEENEQTDAPRKQVLTNEQLTYLKGKLTNLMLIEKPYLDSTLSLPKLAQKLQISTHELSYLINTGFDDNFFNFVNRYRIEESKRILTTPQYQHLSMVGIAFEAGFNSKTAFNTAFKKMVGVSPTEFQKQH